MADVLKNCKPMVTRTVAAVILKPTRSVSPEHGKHKSSSYSALHTFSLLPLPFAHPHPVAAVLGSSYNAGGYATPTNKLSMLYDSDNKDSNELVSPVMAAIVAEVAPVTVESVGHLWWNSVWVPDRDANSVSVHALLDTGSHLDLLSLALVKCLSLAAILPAN